MEWWEQGTGDRCQDGEAVGVRNKDGRGRVSPVVGVGARVLCFRCHMLMGTWRTSSMRQWGFGWKVSAA